MILHLLLLYFELYSSATANHRKPKLFTLATTTKVNNGKEPTWGILHSLDQYERWAVRDSEIFQVLLIKKTNLKQTQHLIKMYLDNLRKKSNLSTIRQLATKFVSLKNHLHANKLTPSAILNLLEINSQQISPNDLFFSISSLLQPQQYNGLYPHQIAKGLEIDIKNSHGGHFNLPQMLEIGLFALSRKWYTRSVEWLHFLYKFAVNSENQPVNHLPIRISFIVNLVSRLFKLVIQQHNRILTQPETEENYSLSINLFSRSLMEKSGYNLKNTRWSSAPPPVILYPRKTFNRLPPDNEDMQYATLCKDLHYETFTPYSRFIHLKCFYEKSIHAYFYINPVKTEHLSDSPPVYIYYEVVTNKLNEQLRKMNGFKVGMNWTSSETRNDIEDRLEKTSTLTGVAKGFSEEFKVLEWISEKLSGLKLSIEKTNRSITYNVYTYGRMLGAHTDVESDKPSKYGKWNLLRNDGERLATLLYYLQPADLGGQTAFCQGGYNVVPQKNSLLVYYHLYRNGNVRPDIDHGSCPVLHGTKIILLAITRYLPNWHSFKCSLNRNE